MKSPRERYENDAAFHMLVNVMVGQIAQMKYTPSEMRDAALLASIIYEEKYVGPRAYSKCVTDWLDGRES